MMILKELKVYSLWVILNNVDMSSGDFSMIERNVHVLRYE